MNAVGTFIRRLLSVLFTPIVSLFGWFFTILLSYALPNTGKRIVFAASLYSHIKKIDATSLEDSKFAELIHEINTMLHLAQFEEHALKVPLLLHEYIWGKRGIPDGDGIVGTDVDFSCEDILRKTPKWLMYDVAQMHQDATTILKYFGAKDPAENINLVAAVA